MPRKALVADDRRCSGRSSCLCCRSFRGRSSYCAAEVVLPFTKPRSQNAVVVFRLAAKVLPHGHVRHPRYVPSRESHQRYGGLVPDLLRRLPLMLRGPWSRPWKCVPLSSDSTSADFVARQCRSLGKGRRRRARPSAGRPGAAVELGGLGPMPTAGIGLGGSAVRGAAFGARPRRATLSGHFAVRTLSEWRAMPSAPWFL